MDEVESLFAYSTEVQPIQKRGILDVFHFIQPSMTLKERSVEDSTSGRSIHYSLPFHRLSISTRNVKERMTI